MANNIVLNIGGIGISFMDILYFLIGIMVFCIILFITVIIQIVKANKLKKKYEKFMQGKEVKSLEKEIVGLIEDIIYLKTSSDKNRKDIRSLYKNLELSYQKMGIVKYDAFKQMGGQLSFSLCLLNDKDNGFIINSVHSTDGCYSYTKEIFNGECKISLGEEEQQALEQAINSNVL